ncbi:MAG: bifunctional folylpolyglutamate synthase/dihydrofolate synthase [Saprospiraceae bacterium]|jgi:dihydrofolate synthase/folylpolyglutamate synthase|nr:bifunctional folylpolyglutamate synthase/dihydrofolate synthase [Saprospiraceae bacterium]
MKAYRDALDYLYAHLPMFQRIGPAAYKKDLGNTLALCEYLGNPHREFPSIHVGGTNGKGSVSHFLAALCQMSGLKTGLYISPHYRDFRERIKINGQYIPRKRVVEFVQAHREKIEEIQPSFFELCVAMAFDHFARERVDIAVIEVGLGGRLDSTNVITPLLSVVTNISYDHMNLLGDTLTLIAGEKAGIIKPGVPVVIGETHPESAPVFLKKAAETRSSIVFADQHFQVLEKETDSWRSTVYDVFRDGKPYLENLEVDVAGPFQQKNLATALQAWEVTGPVLPPLKTQNSKLKTAELTRFMGRWQVIGQNPTVLCDSAHNEAGLRLLVERLLEAPFRQIHFVLGFVNDKSVEPVLALFPPGARYYFAKADIPRGLEATLLREKAASAGLHGRAYSSVKNALRAARRAAAPDDLVVVTGSIFVVAEVV